MAPVPIHASSPISTNHPANAFGTSPSTAAARYTPQTPADVDAGSTTSTNPEPTRTAQPGAPAVPQPTNALSSVYNNRLEPTATRAEPTSTRNQYESPPPPQPGAVPSPYHNTNGSTAKVTIPPPPRPIEAVQQQQQQQDKEDTPSLIRHALPSPTPTRTYPTQSLPLHLYTPTRSVPPAGVTSTYTGPQDLSHPPGYMQDTRASFDDKPVELCRPLDRRASPSSSRRGGILDGEPTFESSNDNESSVLDTAMAWAKAAGKSLSKTEEQVWKRVNGDAS
ncbi:uncharacterized protein A1O9_07546 [Exophiala aquamarina CBS 119918]|uniref:Uncharacterized protein n=1 Tax=Exophiala aquamarina CBS 119918 TaxID=1182545 RepID=A0A072P7X7_9EURO|nr:uncharacterized protein A1O9_07546 [Exophiala aquamarina CBS 119918]KEF55966.1 hypothetical protein A1O9_07546 [Exophiala aquamarina CBS 119918]